MEVDFHKILNIINLSERLKSEKRHNWLSNGDQESVAEHCYRLTLMVYLIAPHLNKPLNLEKALKMALVHDLGEAVVGDIPSFMVRDQASKENKKNLEEEAMETICRDLGREELLELWREFEEGDSLEAKYVRALDRLEMQIQHNQSDLSTWLEIEKKRMFLGQLSVCQFDTGLLKFAEMIRNQSIDKLKEGAEDVEALEMWLEEKGYDKCCEEVGLKVSSCEQLDIANQLKTTVS